MSPSLPGTVLTISLAISLGTVAQWRVVDREIAERLAPRWRAAAMTLELAAVVIVLMTGAVIAYVVLDAGQKGRPVAEADGEAIVAALEWQAGWLAVSAIVPRVVALLPDRTRAMAFNVYGMLLAALLAVLIGVAALIPLLGHPPSGRLLLGAVLPTMLLAGAVGGLFSSWQLPARLRTEALLLDDGLEPVLARYAYGEEAVDVNLWREGETHYATLGALDDAAFQQRRIRRDERRRGRPRSHAPRIILSAPRFEPPVLREGRSTWRDRGLRRAVVVLARQRPLEPDDQERHLVPHPQHRSLWEWPEALAVRRAGGGPGEGPQ